MENGAKNFRQNRRLGGSSSGFRIGERIRLFRRAIAARFSISFPLTPTLSLGEREERHTLQGNRTVSALDARFEIRPPLPKGEGWGEGERDNQRPKP